jgi:tetratricopeptide (TPR) repeat protein
MPPHRWAGLLLAAAACTRSPVPAPATAPACPSPGADAAVLASFAPEGEPAVRSRPEPCGPGAPAALAGRAEAELAASRPARALACAEEALRDAPRLVAALSIRAEALAAIGRLDEARLAFARALAVDPDDPVTLLGASELYVRRLASSRDALEAGLEYARRGARAAERARPRDVDLLARLLLAAGMAENDLGRSGVAMGYLDRAAALRPGDPDVAYERGVALYELCRFGDAERAFRKALELAPEDPWALHQLGLVAERRGDAPRAQALFARARALSPGEFRAELDVDPSTFQAEVDAALAALPEAERAALRGVPVEVRDLPEAADLLAVEPPLSPAILGLFRGPPEGEPCTAADGPRCRSIVLYRKNLLRFARDRAELTAQVRVTLLHELGHLHGESDDELRDRGLE